MQTFGFGDELTQIAIERPGDLGQVVEHLRASPAAEPVAHRRLALEARHFGQLLLRVDVRVLAHQYLNACPECFGQGRQKRLAYYHRE